MSVTIAEKKHNGEEDKIGGPAILVSFVILLLPWLLIGCQSSPSSPARTSGLTALPMASTAPPDETRNAAIVVQTNLPATSPSPAKTTQLSPAAHPSRTASHTIMGTWQSLPTITPQPTDTTSPTPLAPTSTVVVTPSPSITIIQMAGLQPGMNNVTVQGLVVDTSSFSEGFKFTLADETGQVIMLTWHDVYDDFWDAHLLNLGAEVRVTGDISQYEGELQIEPVFASQIQIKKPGYASVPERPIGELAMHMGERVTIVGQIGQVQTNEYGATLTVLDDTGEIIVFIWNNILGRIPDGTKLGITGTNVRVVGIVQEFRSNREVVPSLPYDVEILGDNDQPPG